MSASERNDIVDLHEEVKEETQVVHTKLQETAEKQVAETKGDTTLEHALDKLKPGFPANHTERVIGAVTIGLRLSIVPRRGDDQPLDIDLYSISVQKGKQRQGHATSLVQDLILLAWKKYGRGVFIENCITEDSKAWSASLVQRGIAQPSPCYDDIDCQKYPDCYFCPLPNKE